jgi:spore germination protein KB
MFNFGSSVVMGVSTMVAQDSWISLCAATLYSLPVVAMYTRIISLNPGVDLFSAIENQLGKVAGKVVVALMSWYALHLTALVLRDFSEFIQIASLLATPQIPVLLMILTTVCSLAKYGGKALGKWAVASMPIVLFIVAFTVFFSLGVMHFEHILPIMEHSVPDILKDGYRIFSFPFAETVLFLSIADFIPRGDRACRTYMGATLLSALVLLIIILRNLFVLGPIVVAAEYFPSYVAARIINIGDFLSRIEGTISINFMLAGITKTALCLIAASRGIARLFNLKDYRKIVIPTGLLTLTLAITLYGNAMDLFTFVEYYPLYAIPFQLVLPALVWIVSEVRARLSKKPGADPMPATGR